MKIFELRWTDIGEKEWIAAHTNIQAIKEYCSITSTDLFELDDVDEVIELPESDWDILIVRNLDYDSSDSDDWEEKTFRQFIEGLTSPTLIAGTMYE